MVTAAKNFGFFFYRFDLEYFIGLTFSCAYFEVLLLGFSYGKNDSTDLENVVDLIESFALKSLYTC